MTTESPPADLDRAPRWLRVDQVARLAHVTPRTVRRWVAKGLLVASKPGGGRLIVCRDSLRDLIARTTRG